MTADNGPQHRRGPGDLPGCGSGAPSARSAPACGAGRRAAAPIRPAGPARSASQRVQRRPAIRPAFPFPGAICPARLRERRSVPESDTGSSP